MQLINGKYSDKDYLSSQAWAKWFVGVLFMLVGFSLPFGEVFNSVTIAVLFLVSFKWFEWGKYRDFKIFHFFFLYFLMKVVGLLISDSFNIALDELVRSSAFLIIPIMFINLSQISSKYQLKLALIGMTVSVFLILFSAHVEIVKIVYSGSMEWSALFSQFVRAEFLKYSIRYVHPPYLGLLTISVMVFVFYEKGINRLIKVPLLCYFVFSVYAISGLMSFLLMIGFFFFQLVRIIKKTRSIKPALITLLLMVGIGSQMKFENGFSGMSIVKRVEWALLKGDTSRPNNWKGVLRVVARRPLLGVGSDGGIDYLQLERDEKSEEFSGRFNAHNQFLEVLLRHGILGYAVYIILIFKTLLLACRTKNKLFIWLITFFLFASVTESLLQRQIGLIYFTFIIGMFTWYYSIKKQGYEF